MTAEERKVSKLTRTTDNGGWPRRGRARSQTCAIYHHDDEHITVVVNPGSTTQFREQFTAEELEHALASGALRI